MSSTSNNSSNVIRLHIGPHIALKNAALSTQRRNLLHKINHFEQVKNGVNNKTEPHQDVSNTSNLTTTSNTNQQEQQQQHYRYPTVFPYQQQQQQQEQQQNSSETSSVASFSSSVPPPPTQSLEGNQIGVFKPPTKHLRSVRPVQHAPQQLLHVAQLAALESSPFNLQYISENLKAPTQTREEMDQIARRNQEREDEIKSLKERLQKLQTPKPHVFAATAKPFVSSGLGAGAASLPTSSFLNNANLNNNNNNTTSSAAAASSLGNNNNNNNSNIITSASSPTSTATSTSNVATNIHAKPFVSSISVTNTRQMGFQMNAAANAAPFVPAGVRANSLGNNHNNIPSTQSHVLPSPSSSSSPGRMAGLANGGFGGSVSDSNSTTSFATASSPGASSSSSLFSPTTAKSNNNNNADEDSQKKTENSVEESTKKSTPTTEEAKHESHRSSPDDSDKDIATTTNNNNNKNGSQQQQQNEDSCSNSVSYQDDNSFKSSQFTTTQNSPSKEHNNNHHHRFSKVTVTDFDAIFLKIAPLPRCHVDAHHHDDDTDNVSEQNSSSSTETPTKNKNKEQNEQNDENEDEKSTSTTTTTYSISKFMSLRHHVNSMSAESCSTFLGLVYADWEEHLNRALDNIKKQPSNTLLFSERNIPPIFVGRPEYHDMIVERVEYFKQRPEELKQHFEEKQRKADQEHQNQQQQQQQDEENNDQQEKQEKEATSLSGPVKIEQPTNDYAAAVTHLIDYTVTYSSSALSSRRKKGKDSGVDFSDPNDGSSEVGRGGLFALPTRGRPQKLKSELHNKVLSILSRVTPEKYAALREELLNLPIRQATEDQLSKVVDVFFHKAVQEPKFCGVYADLVMSVFDVAQEEKEALLQRQNSLQMLSPSTAGSTSNLINAGAGGLFPASTPTPQPSDSLTAFEARSAARTEQLAHRLRSALLQKCHAEFSREPKLSEKDLADPDTGKALSREDQEEKWSALKKRLKGNVRFVGELYNRGAVTDVVVNASLSVLLMQVGALATERIPPYARGGACQCFNDHLVDVFVTLLETVGPKFRTKMPDRCQAMIETARKLSVTHRTPRTRVLLMNLVDAADGKGDKRWTHHHHNHNHNHPSSSMSRLGSTVPSMMASRMGSVQDFSHHHPHHHHHSHQQNSASKSGISTTTTTAIVSSSTVPPPPQQQLASSQLNLSSMQGSPVSPHPGSASLGHGFPSSGSFNNLAAAAANNNLPPPTYGSKPPARSPTPPQKGPTSSVSNSNNNNNNIPVSPSASSALPPPPPPSYTDHITNSNPSSPTNGLPRSASRQSLTGTPPHQGLSVAAGGLGSLPPPPPRPQLGERHSSSFNDMHSASGGSLDQQHSTNSSINNIFMASRIASPEKKNSLASLPSSSDLTADESVSLSEAFCRIEKCSGSQDHEDEGEEEQHQNAEQIDAKTTGNNILCFIPITKNISIRKEIFNKKLWQPAEKLSALLSSSSSSSAEIVSDFFLKQFLLPSSEQQQKEKQTIIFSSGLGFLIAHLMSSPNADGSGKRILDPVLAKNSLILALQKAKLVEEKNNNEDEEDAEILIEQVKVLCMGGGDGVSAQEHQRRASIYFEAIGGGNEESEGYQAAQMLFRSWGNFVNKVIVK